jgi:hypothetical protein
MKDNMNSWNERKQVHDEVINHMGKTWPIGENIMKCI